MKLLYKGEQNDNYRANSYALKCMYVGFAVLLFCWILDVFNIFIVDLKIMSIATGGAAVCCGLAIAYAKFIGLDTPPSRYVIMSLLIAMATVICTELAYHTTMFMIFPLVCSAQYFDKRISWYSAALTCAGIAVSVMLGHAIGLCDSNMLLLTYTNSAFHTAALESGSFAINTDETLMFLFFVFPRWLIVLAMMPLLNHVAKDIQIRSEREAMARRQAEIDGLTGIYNRNKYLESIGSYYPNCQDVAVLFFDLNNLKQVNDTMGHEYGDILICSLAEALHKNESNLRKAYRIGGDEFVMILENAECKNVEHIYTDMEKQLQGKPLEKGLQLSVAIGMAAGHGKNIEDIVKEADEKMYQRKTNMKAAAN